MRPVPFLYFQSEIAIWAPGAIIGSLCFLVVILLRFIPETKGRELPHTIEDIKAWEKEPIPNSPARCFTFWNSGYIACKIFECFPSSSRKRRFPVRTKTILYQPFSNHQLHRFDKRQIFLPFQRIISKSLFSSPPKLFRIRMVHQ